MFNLWQLQLICGGFFGGASVGVGVRRSAARLVQILSVRKRFANIANGSNGVEESALAGAIGTAPISGLNFKIIQIF